jgi:hypothetical protein
MEQKIYSLGVWQFEGDVYVPSGTWGASVMQIFGAATHATTLMLHVYDGRITYYHELTKVVADRVYDRWIRLNVVHDVAAGNVTVFVDGERRLEARGHGGKEHSSSSACTSSRTTTRRAAWSRTGGTSSSTPSREHIRCPSFALDLVMCVTVTHDQWNVGSHV